MEGANSAVSQTENGAREVDLHPTVAVIDLEDFCIGHAAKTVGDDYSKLKEDVDFRKKVAADRWFGLEMPGQTSIESSIVPNDRKSMLKQSRKLR
jgi:hypothetical protein